MSESEELSEEEYELEWKNLSRPKPAQVRLKVSIEPEGPAAHVRVTLYGWQMRLITDALCGRLSESGRLPANLLGLNMRMAYFKQNSNINGSEGVVQQCEEQIADIYNSVEMQKMQLDAWAKEQAKLSDVTGE